MFFQLLHRVGRLPRVVIPAGRGDIRAAGVAEVHQVVVELGHVLAGGPLIQGPPVRDAAVQQHHRGAVAGLVQHLPLPDHLPGRRQPGQRPAALPGHRVGPGVPQRRGLRHGCREVLPGHRPRRRRGRPLPGPGRRGLAGKHPGPPPGHRPGCHHDHDAQRRPAAPATPPPAPLPRRRTPLTRETLPVTGNLLVPRSRLTHDLPPSFRFPRFPLPAMSRQSPSALPVLRPGTCPRTVPARCP